MGTFEFDLPAAFMICRRRKEGLPCKIYATDYCAKDLVKLIRDWTELTQEEFGVQIGKNRKIIRNYEQGITDVKLDMLLRMAKVFGIEIVMAKKQ